MRIFAEEVSQVDYDHSSLPNTCDIAVLAYCLGAMLAFETPVLRCLRVTQKATANPRLRHMLGQVIFALENNDCESLGQTLKIYPELLPDDFLQCFDQPEDDFITNSGIPAVADALLTFAEKSDKKPAMLLAKVLQRPDATMEMTRFIHQHYQHQPDSSFANNLEMIELYCSPNTVPLVQQLHAALEVECCISNALFGMSAGNFDHFYVSVIDASENTDKLPLAFKLLSAP